MVVKAHVYWLSLIYSSGNKINVSIRSLYRRGLIFFATIEACIISFFRGDQMNMTICIFSHEIF